VPKNKVKIDKDKCKECKLCIIECKKGIIAVSSELNVLGCHPARITDMSKCTGCTFCAVACPDGLIEVIREEE
jgi:2-oxoglutarate ferredoxin oxidoreductase subunit delta